ncbi:MAG: sporulation protein YabP [Clostridia bacterium]|nr:sporulation protein YabP [Clostridia bacterium]
MTEENGKMPHSLFLEDRKKLSIAGVRDVSSFDEETLIVFTDLGEITVKGEGIKVTRFSVETGDFAATGSFHALSYSDRLPKNSGFFARVFK